MTLLLLFQVYTASVDICDDINKQAAAFEIVIKYFCLISVIFIFYENNTEMLLCLLLCQLYIY